MPDRPTAWAVDDKLYCSVAGCNTRSREPCWHVIRGRMDDRHFGRRARVRGMGLSLDSAFGHGLGFVLVLPESKVASKQG